MSVICEVYQSHEITWKVQGCEPKWDQNEQSTKLHSMTLYPDLDYTSAYGTSTYVRYTSADKIRKLLLAIHEIICAKYQEKAKEKGNKDGEEPQPAQSEVKEAALPPSKTPAQLGYDASRYAKPAEQGALPAPPTVGQLPPPQDAAQNTPTEQGKLPAPEETKLLPAPEPAKEETGKEEGTPPVEETKPKEEEKEEKEVDCCDYYVKITTSNLRMIEPASGASSFKFRYLMSQNLIKDFGDGELNNTDKIKIEITTASNAVTKLLTPSFEMELDEFNSTDTEYPGNLIIAIIPTLELEFGASESLPSKESAKSYSEVSAKLLKQRILQIEFDPANQNLTDAQREEKFKEVITKWEEETRKDVEGLKSTKNKATTSTGDTTGNKTNINNKKV